MEILLHSLLLSVIAYTELLYISKTGWLSLVFPSISLQTESRLICLSKKLPI